ncbi:MAG: hypothetical protein ABEJ98_05140 [Candidatus Nanohaloarchaea archaeon]
MEVALTDTARGKTGRLLSEEEIRERVKTLKGRLYKVDGKNVFHLVFFSDRLDSWMNIIFSPKKEKRVVISQMHDHGRNDPELEEVGRL